MAYTPLDYEPFEGDFGCPGDTTLRDAMVKARKTHACTHCAGQIVPGETYRSRSDIADGDMMSWKWCALCCAAMVLELSASDDDSDEPRYPFCDRAAQAQRTEGGGTP